MTKRTRIFPLIFICLALFACTEASEVDGSTFEDCPGDPNGLVCDVYADGFSCPAGAERTVIDCRPLCQDAATCEEVAPVGENPEDCPGDPNGLVCDVYADGFSCPAGAERTVIDCRPLCQDAATCEEVPPVWD